MKLKDYKKWSLIKIWLDQPKPLVLNLPLHVRYEVMDDLYPYAYIEITHFNYGAKIKYSDV